MTLGKGWIGYAEKALRIAKMLERRVWGHQLALRQVRVRVRVRVRALTLTLTLTLTPTLTLTLALRQIGNQPEYIYQKLEEKHARAETP